MDIGKLYRLGGDEFIVKVDYRFHDESPVSWWGELVPKEYRRLSDGDGYIIELEDGRKGRCSLRKRVNRAVSGIPPLYHYQFKGRGQLE
ncbi:MAG: hypothetical protein IMY81_01470 [Chloroflexi bacterium]|nr:hypothetical protein [Chloroflexota bacterium]